MIGQLTKVLNITQAEVEKGLELHKKFVIVDGSCGSPHVWSDEMTRRGDELIDSGQDLDNVMREFSKMQMKSLLCDPGYREKHSQVLKKSGVSSIAITIDHPTFLEGIAQWIYMFDRLGDIYKKFTRTADIRKAKQDGRTVILWYSQHETDYIGRDLKKLELLKRLGIKIVHIAHNQRNFFGDGGEERTDCGLSNLGVEAVAKMNELGLLIDTSHTGQRTTIDCAENSKDGIVSIHTGCRAVHNHPHNKTDEVLKAIAEGGGMAGIYMSTNFLSPEGGNIVDWLNHIDHAVEIMGIDHVAIGTENHDRTGEPKRLSKLEDAWYQLPVHGVKPGDHAYDPSRNPPWPEELESWTNWPNLTIGLVSRGYSDQEIEKIVGGNWLALYERVLEK